MLGRAIAGCATALAIVAALALPAAAAEEELVPPGNSAIDQYTETYPSSGGDRASRGGGADRTPAQALGPRKARQLERRGPAGEETAALVAATAPAEATTAARGGGEGAGGDRPRSSQPAPAPAASSGPGEVLGGATGLSSGPGPSLLLPLALLATALWAATYLWRRTRHRTGP